MDEKRLNRILRQHIQTDALLGVTAVPVGAVAANPVSTAAQLSASSSPDVPMSVPDVDSGPRDSADIIPKEVMAGKKLSKSKKLQILNDLDEQQVRPCARCILCESRTQTVFGEGNPDAELMFIGEGPGQTEDELGRPFVGRAGQLLDKMIVAMGLERKDVYIANVVKCRPPNNRTPLADEVDECSDYLRTQIMTIQPSAIVTLGGPAAKLLLQTNTGITRLRGQWHDLSALMPDGPHIPVMPTFHPAYLLRQYTQENRKKVWSDLQQVMERIQS